MTISVVACPSPVLQFFDNRGNPLVGGTLLTQVGGVNYPTYQDSAGTTALPNPITLNSRGEVADATGTSRQLFVVENTVYTFTLSDASGNQIWSEPYINGVVLTAEEIAALVVTVTDNPVLASLVRSAGEIAANVTPTNYSIGLGIPERYGAKGDGTTNDTTALVNCLKSNNFISLTPGKTYLYDGLTISTVGASIFTPGGTTSTAILKLSDGTGNVGLHFVDSSGNTTHFDSGFSGRNFQITCASGASQMTGIYCDNAELDYLEKVIIDLSPNTYAGGSSGGGTIAFNGFFQQDGAFVKCTFTGGSGLYGDGVFLTGSVASNELPNNNLFLGCRAQSCGGFGVHLLLGDGNVWIGGKIQSNTQGGWSDDTDGLTHGPSNSVIADMGFEANSGDDLYINISQGITVSRCSFGSTTATNAIHAPAFLTQGRFSNNNAPAGKPATFAGNTGTGNTWSEDNYSFSPVTLPSGVFDSDSGGVLSLTYGATISVDASTGALFAIVASNTTAFTISNPTNPRNGKVIVFDIKNLSGGAMGTITWGTSFELAGAFTNPANNYHRTITFCYDGTYWREIARVSADES